MNRKDHHEFTADSLVLDLFGCDRVRVLRGVSPKRSTLSGSYTELPCEVLSIHDTRLPWQDIASVSTKCHAVKGREGCIEELRQKACQEGGDTVYDFKDGRQGVYTLVVATIGIRKAPSTRKAVQPDSTAATSECNPPCSPGYRCSGKECNALCNPPCDGGMVCNRRRVCEPIALTGGN